MSLPHKIGCNALMTTVCLSVSPVPDPKSGTEGHSKLKVGKEEAHDMGDP